MNGKIYQEGFFKNDNEEGIWKTYSDFRKLRYEEEYEKGIRQKITKFE